MKKILISLTALLATLTISAEITLPKILGSNMVLQQQSEANLWGKATADKKITVTTSWSKKKITTRSDKDGNWAVKV
ncbi:MAG: sialate O-acetylesterase, partial [Bacteroidaceae bacterium]|nr:sialate O-acetylesterase [Bacteroidaceae bacterium]